MKFSQLRLICTLILLCTLTAITVAQITINLTRVYQPQVLTEAVPIVEPSNELKGSYDFTSVTKPEQAPTLVIPVQPLITPIPETIPLVAANPQSSYRHLPYAEAPIADLEIVGKYYDRIEKLHYEGKEAFKKMQAAANAEGIGLEPISGFRTIADQEFLFKRQIARQGSPEAAARLSAPPGYSEHHTGYAIDIGDASDRNADLQFVFEYTRAYIWLNKNAKNFGFKQSFPQNNLQGVSFEPWHWRYQKSKHAAQIFDRAIAKFH